MIVFGKIRFWQHQTYAIVRQDVPHERDVFLHHRVARQSGLDPRQLPEDAAVRLEVEETPRGLRATHVERI